MGKDYTAIRVEPDAKEAAEQAKKDGETWSDYIRRCTENPPKVKEYVEALNGSTVTDDAKREILGRLDDLEARLPRKVGEELKG